jgi:hypothetical protein
MQTIRWASTGTLFAAAIPIALAEIALLPVVLQETRMLLNISSSAPSVRHVRRSGSLCRGSPISQNTKAQEAEEKEKNNPPQIR